MRRSLTTLGLVAGVLACAGKALALSEELHEPRLYFPKDNNQRQADAVGAVLRDKHYHFLDGVISYWPPKWSTTLVYEGDARSVNEFVAALGKMPGVRVRVTFSPDAAKETGSALRAGSWWVLYSHADPDTITIRVNLSAKDLRPEELDLQLGGPSPAAER